MSNCLSVGACGYNRAAYVIDYLERIGVLGPGEGAQPRAILVDLNTYTLSFIGRKKLAQQIIEWLRLKTWSFRVHEDQGDIIELTFPATKEFPSGPIEFEIRTTLHANDE